MRKKRLQKTTAKSRRSTRKKSVAIDGSLLRRLHFVGVSVAGGKTDKATLAFVEYYPEQNKIFLSQIVEKLKSEGDVSGDLQIVESIESHSQPIEMVAFNAPLTLPKCLRCVLRCPGFEVCTETSIQWMWKQYREKIKPENNKSRLFTPYTERCAEMYLTAEFEEDFQIQHALGANMAPLFARASFLGRRVSAKKIEVNPKVSLWRIGQSLNIQKSYLKFHRHSVDGEEARTAILMALVKKDIAFLYEQDVRLMVNNPHAFDAFVCALTAVLRTKGQCEQPPSDYPSDEAWIEIPAQDIIW
jgi:hypothetical protein